MSTPKWNECPHQSGKSVHTKVESVSTPKWNECPHQSGISVHTKVESVSTPKWNECPHQSGISVHTKVESVSTPKWNQCPHQRGISTPPKCNVYTITKFKQYTIILTLISLHRSQAVIGGGLVLQYFSGWLFERNRAIGRYFKITCINHNPIVLVTLTIGLVVCVILASIDLISLFPHCSLFLSNNQPECTVQLQ